MLIRPATPADIPEILALIRELADYEKEPASAVATHADLHRALFGTSDVDGKGAGIAECLLAEQGGAIGGFALFFMNFSTWTGKPGIYLEDLFVRPALRGHGLGKALLVILAQIAVQRGCARMEWSVLDWNTPAIEFYRSLGAVAMDGWTVNRVTGPALQRLAALIDFPE
jgi:GNAT superfamily N-acetyltransferase